jgi:RimJ/RimL family protein N-acetyltransferase
MTIEIRKATPEDFERMRPLMEEWIAESNPDGLKFDPEAERLIDTFAKLASLPNCTTLVMLKDGLVIGCVGLIRHGWGACKTENFATENLWYVGRKYAGHARELVTAAKKWAFENDCDYLIFSANRLSCERAERGDEFLSSIGFRPLYGLHIAEVRNV